MNSCRSLANALARRVRGFSSSTTITPAVAAQIPPPGILFAGLQHSFTKSSGSEVNVNSIKNLGTNVFQSETFVKQRDGSQEVEAACVGSLLQQIPFGDDMSGLVPMEAALPKKRKRAIKKRLKKMGVHISMRSK